MPTLDVQTVMPLAVFAAMTLGAWGLLGLFAGRPGSADDRLRRLLNPRSPAVAAATVTNRQAQFQTKVTAAAGKLGKSLRPSDDQELGKIRVKLLNAGFRHEQSVAVYYGAKLILLLLGLGIAFPALGLRYGMSQTAYVFTAAAAALGFYLPDYVVGAIKKKRGESIFLGLPDALDLMVVCVEAGLGLDAAMRRVTSELAESCPVICEEFAIANFQLQMGRARKDVLRDLGTRTGVDDVRALAAVIIQAEKFGSSIASALRVQSDAMRVRRRQLAEERAAKTSVKIMLPLIFFIFPGVFVVLVGPAIIKMMGVFGGH
jgi:tight adherence protein C